MTDTSKLNHDALDAEALRRENEALRRRIAELEATCVSCADGDGVRSLAERTHLLHAVIDKSPSVIFVKAVDGRYLLVNRRAETLYAKTRAELLGHYDSEFFPPEAVQAMKVKDDEALARGEPIQFEESVPFHGELRHYVTIKFPIMGLDGAALGVCGIATDVTEHKREEAERLLMREQVIAAQDEALRELSTPLVPIAQGVVAMPLIGAIDSKRADLIVTALLDGVNQQSVHTAILDITGVRTVDSHVAGALVMAARAVGLLGARVVVTGIRPEVARTLVDLGADLAGIVTRATLRSGIAYALGR
ncbi:MAG: PAS domain-containing protein [Polyangiaceae bacterium]|nr:PAS domain-containing protein [Polyangiaceae bacterium]